MKKNRRCDWCRPGWPCRSRPPDRAGGSILSCSKRGPAIGHAVREWSHVKTVLAPGRTRSTRAAGAFARADPVGTHPDPQAYPNRRRVARTLSSSRSRPRTKLREPHPNVGPRDRHQPHRLRQGQDCRPRKCAIRASLSQRRRRQDAARADAVIDASGTWVHAQSRRRRRLARARRRRGHVAHRLRHAGCAGRRALPVTPASASRCLAQAIPPPAR